MHHGLLSPQHFRTSKSPIDFFHLTCQGMVLAGDKDSSLGLHMARQGSGGWRETSPAQDTLQKGIVKTSLSGDFISTKHCNKKDWSLSWAWVCRDSLSWGMGRKAQCRSQCTELAGLGLQTLLLHLWCNHSLLLNKVTLIQDEKRRWFFCLFFVFRAWKKWFSI